MIGTRLGQYRIDALLGQGGMGAVYLATDEMLGRQVAIKVLREDADARGTATERFRSEAQILSRLDHPHILRLYGFSQHEGVLYMVTEFVRGEALQKRLERGGAVAAPQVVEWAGQVLDALDYAHQLGVVHRDIKPANILIDERNRARLLDFGIARIVGTEGPTQTGHAVGTLTYMAPEQVLDEAIDGRADIYAFAVVACQMLAGRKPYRATTTAGLIREIVDGPAPDVAGLLPPHAASFVPVLLRALARHPADRTPTAARMRQELQAALTMPVLAPPPLPPLAEAATPTATGPLTPGPGRVTGHVDGATAEPARTVTAPVVTVTSTGPVPVPPPVAAPPPVVPPSTVPPARTRKVGALAYAVPVVLLLAAMGVGWALFGRARLVTPRIVTAPMGSTGVSAESPVAPATDTTAGAPATTAAEAPRPVMDEPVPAPVPAPEGQTASVSAVMPGARPAGRPSAGAAARGASSPGVAAAAAAPPSASPVATPEPAPAPPPAVPATGAAPATAEFKDLILMDRIDDEDEEIDVSVRLDQRRVVVLDEDGVAKRSIAYDAIARATYNTRKPGRFSLRRGPSHWLTLEVGTTPIVLRLNGKSYEQVLTTLAGHGVRVERQP